MKVTEIDPVPHAIVRWRNHDDTASLVLKLTFELDGDGSAQLARNQRRLAASSAATGAPSDLVPGKRWVDLLVVGHAKCKAPQRVIPVRFALDPVYRSVYAHASEAATRLPLASMLRCQAQPGSPPAHVGPGPAPAFSEGEAVSDLEVFNVAPGKQRVAAIQEDSVLELEGLVGDGSPFRTRLPVERPFAVIRDGHGNEGRLELRCDTLLVDVDDAVMTMTWRTRLASTTDDTSLLIGVESAHEPLSCSEIRRRESKGGAEARTRKRANTRVLDCDTVQLVTDGWPFRHGSSLPPPPAPRAHGARAGDTQPGFDEHVEDMDAAPDTEPGQARGAATSWPPLAAPTIPPPSPTPVPLAVRPPNPLAEQGYGAGPAPSIHATPPPSSEPEPIEESEPPPPSSGPRSAEDVDLELCGALTAALDIYPEHRAALLDDERLTDDDWRRAEQRWRESIATGVHRADTSTLAQFDEAYVRRLEVERGPIDLEGYASLELAIERGDVSEVVVRLGIPRPAVIRLKRVWTRRLLGDSELRQELRTTIRRLRV